MQITFIDPPNFLEKKPIERVFGCTYSLYPIPNIFSLSNAALLEREGFKVNYIDMANERWGLPRFRAFFKSDQSSAYVFYSVNLSLQPDLLAFEFLRESRPDAYVIFSGPAPTYFARNFLKDKNTFVVRGETEFTLLELMRNLRDGVDLKRISGISFLEDGENVDNPDRYPLENPDILPYPARHLLKKGLYYNPKLPKRPFTALQTSRNCPYRCIFCVPNSYNFARELEYRHYHNTKPPVRIRSAENVIEEFNLLQKDGYRSVSIIDDQFLWDDARTIKICEGIRDLGIKWGCLARADRISDNVAMHLAGAGCRYVDIGIESFNQAVLDDVKKDLKIEKAYDAISILKKHKLIVKINLLLGVSPLQNRHIIKEDMRKAKELDVDAAMFSLATPFPGTEFYQRAKEKGWFAKDGYYPASVQIKGIISYPGLSYKDLERMVKTANLSFYFSPRFLIKNLKQIFHPVNLYRGLVALKRKFI